MAKPTLSRSVSAIAAALLVSAAPVSAAPDESLQSAIAGEHRAEANGARDQYRHPYETLTFFGIKPDLTVVEIWPGAGWYTEILAPYLRDEGKLYAAHFDPEGGVEYFVSSRERFEQKLAAAPALYDQVELTTFAPNEPMIAVPAGSADLVVTFRNVHNWYMRGGGEQQAVAAFRQFFDVLKPGGVLGVVEHRLPASRPLEDQEASGYMSEGFVIRVAAQAGFQLLEKSQINGNPRDHTNHPKGVWTLPPSLAEGDNNRDDYIAIGESDRMTLKFIKPDATEGADGVSEAEVAQ